MPRERVRTFEDFTQVGRPLKEFDRADGPVPIGSISTIVTSPNIGNTALLVGLAIATAGGALPARATACQLTNPESGENRWPAVKRIIRDCPGEPAA